MDPNANLYEQIKCATRIMQTLDVGEEIHSDDAYQLAELVVALDGWIRKGGFLPTQWERGK